VQTRIQRPCGRHRTSAKVRRVCVCVCARARARATEQRRVPTSKGAAAHHHSCGQIFPPRKSKQHCVMQQAQRRAFLTLLRVRTPHAFLTLGRFQGFTMLLDAGRQSEVPRCLGVSQAPYRISPTQLVAQQRSAIREARVWELRFLGPSRTVRAFQKYERFTSQREQRRASASAAASVRRANTHLFLLLFAHGIVLHLRLELR
jgi:hypothetical protein